MRKATGKMSTLCTGMCVIEKSFLMSCVGQMRSSGLLHLLGMDHMDSDDAEQMERREQQLLSRFWRPTN